MRDGASRRDARDALDAIDHAIIEITPLIRLRISRSREIERHDQYAGGAKSGIHRYQTHETVDHQARADEQHERQPDFAGDEHVSKPAPFGIVGHPVGFAKPRRVDARGTERRYESGGKSGQQRNPHGQRDPRPAELRRFEQRDADGWDRGSEIHDPRSNEETHGAAEYCKDETFDDQLANDAGTAGPKCRANRDLPLTVGSSRQKQIGDVGAPNQQHEANRRNNQP